MHSTHDTIAALATAPGAAGLAVVRVSGPRAIAIASRVFRGRATLDAAPGHTLHHGWIEDGGARVDEVVVALFRAPRSYTREDVVEISCHGGRLPAGRVLDALRAAGARAAAPGEFTLRAFLHGRLDLAQAEAVADVIAAESRAAHEMALSQLAGTLSRQLAALAEALRDALAEVEARVDFAEDVGGVEVPAHVVRAIRDGSRALDGLLAGAPWARAVREGVKVPIVGRPNAGKSSLFNALLGEERAIVTPEPGTTRDRVSETVELEGVRVTLSDTAGLRESAGAVESLGIARTREVITEAAALIWVVDGSAPLDDADRAIAATLPARTVVALNKSDRPSLLEAAEVRRVPQPAGAGNLEPEMEEPWPVVRVSATRGDGLDALRSALLAALGGRPGADLTAAAGNARHTEALGRARAALARAADATDAPGEIVAVELREALAAIGEVTGQGVGEDLLDRIFGRFCVGK